jgi:ATP-dependent DNA helicase PIF1
MASPPGARPGWKPRPKAKPDRTAPDPTKGPYAGVFDLIEGGETNVLLSGRAGSGKTTFLRGLIARTKRKAVVVAPSGVAALNAGGQTLHSLFNLPPRLIEPSDIKKAREGRVIANLDLLIIDEISMVRADMLDAIDRSLRLHRGNRIPFGGAQVLCIGDLAQLPPVVERDVAPVLAARFGGPYFFHAPAFREAGFTSVVLQRVFRQQEGDFLSLLDRMRLGHTTDDDMALLETRVRPERPPVEASAIVLTATNEAARRINDEELARLPGEPVALSAKVDGEFDARLFPTDENLVLKPGARVVLLRNDPDGRWVNGSLAEVVSAGWDGVEIAIGGEVHDLEKVAWERMIYSFDAASDAVERRVAGTFRQYPIKPAWALTIHKAQGLTFDAVHVDLGRGAFAHGQSYVALSRCRSLEGLTLSRPLSMRDVIVDPQALAVGRIRQPQNFGDWRMGALEPAPDPRFDQSQPD